VLTREINGVEKKERKVQVEKEKKLMKRTCERKEAEKYNF